MALTDEVQKVGGTTKQELFDRKIYWWFEDEKDLKDDLEWLEKKSELNENDGLQWQVSGDLLGDLFLILLFVPSLKLPSFTISLLYLNLFIGSI